MTAADAIVAGHRARRARFLYLTEFDLSIDSGHGINEREFVTALRRRFPDDVHCMAPQPAHPEVFHDPSFTYVPAPRGVAGYGRFLVSAFRSVVELRRRLAISALVCRLGPTPVLPLAIQHGLRLPVLLKTLALYSRFADDGSVRYSRSRRADWVARTSALLVPAYRSLLRRSPFMDTVGPVYAEWLCERFGLSRERLHVFPNGYNPERFSPGDAIAARRRCGLARFEGIVGYVGALTTMRHIDHLVRSFALAPIPSNVGLVMVGAGDDLPELERLAAECGVADRVVFTGSVPYEQVPDYLRSFDVAVDLTLVTMQVGGRAVPSSFSQKIPQYLGTGLPVVAWDTPDTRFLQEHGIGALVPMEHPDRLAGVLRKLLTVKEAERRALQRRAVAYARQELAMERLVERRFDGWTAALGVFGANADRPAGSTDRGGDARTGSSHELSVLNAP